MKPNMNIFNDINKQWCWITCCFNQTGKETVIIERKTSYLIKKNIATFFFLWTVKNTSPVRFCFLYKISSFFFEMIADALNAGRGAGAQRHF